MRPTGLRKPRLRITVVWTAALAAAVLWPGHVLSPLDGLPLNGHAEAVLLGVALPALWWIDRAFLARPLARAAIVALLVVKAASSVALPQHGLCARFSTTAPFDGVSGSIPIDEPTGSLRSWDVRADWQATAPRCTAILDRPYRSRSEFAVWFLNLLDAIRPNGHDLSLDVAGFVTVDRPGTFAVETGRDMAVAGGIGDAAVSAAGGAPIVVPLAAGSHAIRLHVASSGGQWQFVPLWNGRDAWTSARLTTSASSWLDGAVSRSIAFGTTAIVALLLAAWLVSALTTQGLSGSVLIWMASVAALFAAAGAAGRFERFASLSLVGGAFLPVARRQKNVRTVFMMLGVPWLALFVAHSWPEIGRPTLYSLGDDWHMYQSAAYRIFMNGYWIQGGSETFYFQPLYRWVAGALHIIFGDSSVGELYWDAGCLLSAALLCYGLVKRVCGFEWGVAAAALTLATFTMSSIWYVIGRGLAEITALGWLSCASLFLLRARLGRARAALAAGIFAVLMFYTRLNHLLLAGFLLCWLLPLGVDARWREVWRAVRRVRVAPVAIYLATIVVGVVLFAARTWRYTGHFSLLFGTSFVLQQTGLHVATAGSSSVWAKIGESLAAQLSMQDPPSVDARSLLVVAGALLSLMAAIQVPYIDRLPAGLALITLGTIVGSVFAHAHAYPGRMSVHVVPFAVAMSVCGVARVARAWTARHTRGANLVPPVAT